MSAEIRFNNGATVSRAWTGNTELLAAFQYSTDAEAFADAKLAEDVAREWLDSTYIVADLNSGKVKVVRHKAGRKA